MADRRNITYLQGADWFRPDRTRENFEKFQNNQATEKPHVGTYILI